MTEKELNDDAVIAYFKMIQNVITRMAQNSFLIKAWTITILAGVMIFSISKQIIFMCFIILTITSMFWVLDSYYLKLEKSYRNLFNFKTQQYNHLLEKETMMLFDMNYKKYSKSNQNLLKIMLSKSELLFYATLIVILVLFLLYCLFTI